VTMPATLPGGGTGTQVQVPIVAADRVDSNAATAVADIPLASAASGDVLVAHVAVGYGLSATGGASTTAADGSASLIAAIEAAAASSGSDATPLTGNGHTYLAQLASNQPLLVETVVPVNAPGVSSGTLTLSAANDGQQHVALVIQAGGMTGGTIALQNVEFAAVIGAATVVAQAGTKMLTGDAASQDFTVQSADGTQLFAGGGSDTLRFGSAPASVAHDASGGTAAAAVATDTLLHGGSGADTAVFSGARADFDIDTHNGYLVVHSKAAPEATALVVNVEQLQFSDTTVKVQDSGAMDTLAGIYQTALGRQADVYGIEFWANARQADVSWGRIALDIIDSPEYAASHEAFNGNAEHDISMLYTALFGRAPDAPGLAFWVDGMRHGASLEHIATEFVQSVEMIGHQRAATDWDFIV
jgi:large repetitive protein